MNILVLTNLFPSRAEPTRGVFNLNRFRPVADRAEMHLIAPLPWWSRVRRPSTLLETTVESWTGIEARFPSYWSVPGIPRLHAAGMYRSLAPLVRRMRAEFPFDAILAAFGYPDGVAAARLAQEHGVPLVTMVLGSDVNAYSRVPALRRQLVWGLSQASTVIAVSDALRSRMVEIGVDPAKIVVQQNGVDGDRFTIKDQRELRQLLGLRQDRPLLCYVGNLKPEKGPDVLLRAIAAHKRASARDVELAIVGSGEMEPRLKAMAAEMGIEDNVRFHGRRPHGEIPDWIGASDALCLPSYREGCPNVLLEALASGRPVIASRVGGVPEMLDKDNGFMVPAGDSDAMAAAIGQVIAREWDPTALRATVPCLSWDVCGATIHRALLSGIETNSQNGVPAGVPLPT